MEPEYQEHAGHRIELRGGEEKPELFIDDVPIKYSQLANGEYYLQNYAHDFRADLLDLAAAYVDYQRRKDKVLGKDHISNKEEK